jgi:shikimate dehydrogenase
MADPAGAGRYGVLGWPVGHSRSPVMMQAAGLQRYQRLPVAPEAFDDTVLALGAAGFLGANVTIPHKQAALALATSASDAAREIGAANTLSFDEDGSIAAENTDAPGLMAALGRTPASALVLGAGGSARAAVWALTQAGADVSIWNRTAERARGLGARVVQHPVAAEVLVNCTSVGLHHTSTFFQEVPLDADALSDYATVVDLVYRAGGTALIEEADRRGLHVVDGLEILVRQGALSFSLWTGLPAPLERMRAAVRAPQPEVDVARSDST